MARVYSRHCVERKSEARCAMRKKYVVGLLAVLVVLGGVSFTVINRDADRARHNPTVAPSRLVETLGADRPAANYDDGQWAVQQFESANGRGNYTGWAGSAPDDGKLKVWWKGTLPPPLHDELVTIAERVPVEIYRTKFSSVEIEDAINSLEMNDLCEGGSSYGSDSLQTTTDRDPSSVDVPQKTSNGVPILIEQGTCPDMGVSEGKITGGQ